MSKTQECPICGKNVQSILVERKEFPLVQNTIIKKKETAENVRAVELILYFCTECEFAFAPYFDDKYNDELYSTSYNAERSFSPMVSDYLDSVIEFILLGDQLLENVIEIGCGDADFCDA